MSHDPPAWVRDGASGFQSPNPAAASPVGPREWELALLPMRYWDAKLGVEFVVPVGQRTDWGSSPRPLWWFVDPMLGIAATLLHDYLWRVLVPAGVLSYRDADRIFRQALRSLGVDRFTAWTMWAAVRIGALGRGPAGRAGWGWTAPGVVAIAVPTVVLLAVPTVVLAPFAGIIWLLRWLTR